MCYLRVFILQGNDILGSVNQEEYERIIQLIEGAILATDLALYFRFVYLL